ncbi:MAG TPA: hypothetical protein VMZ02_02965 [Candidatus Limnocylindrales bacterium]|nr:hypothetical protein [Candidatus Limnocylindrales bacterium]
MLSKHRGDLATAELQGWAQEVANRVDPAVQTEVLFEEDSNTFILRLAKDARVLVFRLSASQVYTDGREPECERTLIRKIKDLWNLL